MLTQRPGFRDAVHDSQQTFRALLDALACPGQIRTITADLSPPPRLMPACAAACLTLLDLDVNVWLQPGWGDEVWSWLMFHAGCRFVTDAAIAQVALIHTWNTAPTLADFHLGTPEDPELSTTLLIQLEGLKGHHPVTLQGPGIRSSQTVSPHVPPSFWEEWNSNHQLYPQGVDVFLFHRHNVMGLPRSTDSIHS